MEAGFSMPVEKVLAWVNCAFFSCECIQNIDTVDDRTVFADRLQIDTAGVTQCGQKIDGTDELVTFFSGRNDTRPTDDAGDASAPFQAAPFFATVGVGLGHLSTLRSVVG